MSIYSHERLLLYVCYRSKKYMMSKTKQLISKLVESICSQSYECFSYQFDRFDQIIEEKYVNLFQYTALSQILWCVCLVYMESIHIRINIVPALRCITIQMIDTLVKSPSGIRLLGAIKLLVLQPVQALTATAQLLISFRKCFWHQRNQHYSENCPYKFDSV